MTENNPQPERTDQKQTDQNTQTDNAGESAEAIAAIKAKYGIDLTGYRPNNNAVWLNCMPLPGGDYFLRKGQASPELLEERMSLRTDDDYKSFIEKHKLEPFDPERWHRGLVERMKDPSYRHYSFVPHFEE